MDGRDSSCREEDWGWYLNLPTNHQRACSLKAQSRPSPMWRQFMSEEGNPLTRRDFVRGTVGAAVAASLLGTSLESQATPAIKSYVAVVRDQAALNPANQVNEPALREMLTQVLKMVTGKSDPASAWRVLVRTTDIVGLVHTDHLNKTHPELVEL